MSQPPPRLPDATYLGGVRRLPDRMLERLDGDHPLTTLEEDRTSLRIAVIAEQIRERRTEAEHGADIAIQPEPPTLRRKR